MTGCSKTLEVASIIFAAGYGSRIKNFSGNKTILPLKPGPSTLEGECPVIGEIIKNLPEGPKALVVHHKKDEVIKATRDMGVFYYEQAVPNGTGGALIAAGDFLERVDQEYLIITMGDTPFVDSSTYGNLIDRLGDKGLVVLGFKPRDKAQYGILEIEGDKVKRIHEWRYWREYPVETQNSFEISNSGIYAIRKSLALEYLDRLKQKPHKVEKERNGQMVTVEEYFVTDLVELIGNDGYGVGFALAGGEDEVMGIDTIEDLVFAQGLFARMKR